MLINIRISHHSRPATGIQHASSRAHSRRFLTGLAAGILVALLATFPSQEAQAAQLTLAWNAPQTNADGLPAVAPTPEQRYLFDAQGWILIPGLLGQDEVEQ